jgi:drug/metabolite transporter (DMT)-like permease
MQLDVTVIVLCAALFHAVWNGLVKGGKDPLLESMVISLIWIAICLILLPFLPMPALESWPFICASVIIHVCYFLLLSKTYQIGDFSAVYPIVRGLPPLIVTIICIFVIDEPLSLYGGVGVALIGAGILALEAGNKYRSYKLLGFAFATVLMITAYTIVDSLGARISGNSTSFLVWFSLFKSIIFVSIVFFLRNKEQCIGHIKTSWKRGLIAGVLSFSTYAIILWAVTKASIPYVSALRETSVLFSCIIAMVFLGEPFRKSRIISAILIFLGICTIKLG